VQNFAAVRHTVGEIAKQAYNDSEIFRRFSVVAIRVKQQQSPLAVKFASIRNRISYPHCLYGPAFITFLSSIPCLLAHFCVLFLLTCLFILCFYRIFYAVPSV